MTSLKDIKTQFPELQLSKNTDLSGVVSSALSKPSFPHNMKPEEEQLQDNSNSRMFLHCPPSLNTLGAMCHDATSYIL